MPHAVSSTSAALPKFKNRRVERTSAVEAGDEEIESPATQFVAISHMPVGISGNPFYYTAVVDTFGTPKGIAGKGQTPRDRPADVGAKRVSIEPNYGVPKRRQRQPAQRGPELRWRR